VNIDRDLRDALSPLSGDPVADAQAVLARLPGGGGPNGAPQKPWLPWTLLGLGLLGGFVAGRWSSGAVDDTSAGTGSVAGSDGQRGPAGGEAAAGGAGAGQPAVDPPGGEPREPKQPPPIEPVDHLGVMAFGPIEVDEPTEGRSRLEPGEWLTAFGTQFVTGDGQAGVYLYADDSSVRIDRDTIARVRPGSVVLDVGRMAVDAGGRGIRWHVEVAGGITATVERRGMFSSAPSGVDVVSLAGTVDVRVAGRSVRLGDGERVFIVPDGGITERGKVEFLPAATSWMTTMIEMGRDTSELQKRVTEVVAAYEDGRYRDLARREILRLGSRCTWLLADSVERRLSVDRDYALDAAQLIARLVDFRTAQYALPLLAQEDEQVRLIVFDGIRGATGTDADTDADFWQVADREQRRAAIQRWRYQLTH